jgi:hypothetical protein
MLAYLSTRMLLHGDAEIADLRTGAMGGALGTKHPTYSLAVPTRRATPGHGRDAPGIPR